MHGKSNLCIFYFYWFIFEGGGGGGFSLSSVDFVWLVLFVIDFFPSVLSFLFWVI